MYNHNHNKLWTHQDINQALGVAATDNFEASGVSLDSRTLQKGDLFIALHGPHHDGAQYVLHAFDQGAAAALVPFASRAAVEHDLGTTGTAGYGLETVEHDLTEDKSHHRSGQDTSKPCVYVEDIQQALQKLAIYARQRSQAKIVGVTGSFGKTSTKEALKLILSSHGSVTASQRSFNNHWGVPYTLMQLQPQDHFGVIEMGMNNPGEIDVLSKLARPHVALILNVRAMHLQGLGSIEDIARAKAEIFSGMMPGDIAIINTDDTTHSMTRDVAQQRGLKILSFGSKPEADFQLKEVRSDIDRLSLKIRLQDQERSFSLPSLGAHHALNILGILAVAQAVHVDINQAIASLQQYQLMEGRGRRHVVSYKTGHLTVIDESYNAGFDSMSAALNVLGHYQTGRRIAILGDMGEMGSSAVSQHQSLRQILCDNAVDLVFTCGAMMKNLHDVLPSSMKAGHALEVKGLIPEVLKILQPDDVIMIKGSKGQYAERGRMYAFVTAILTQATATNIDQKGMTKRA